MQDREFVSRIASEIAELQLDSRCVHLVNTDPSEPEDISLQLETPRGLVEVFIEHPPVQARIGNLGVPLVQVSCETNETFFVQREPDLIAACIVIRFFNPEAA